MATARLAHALRALLRQQPAISYDDIAAHLDIDRRTAIRVVRQLQLAGQVRVRVGRGGRPNRYHVVDTGIERIVG